ncbi:hypothetical protein TrST_g11754 [Triparma strigata]|uniref:Esterase n=1 Tax=Triparma strigata TaxID=1606541 RepID=A0A9W7EJQ9_9STRA|nr:hypothetical protein TrST_g11754 [Triparma strigata]
MYANGDEWDTNQVFGFDAEFDKDTLSYTLEENHFGYPIASLLDLPPSAYTVQAELAVFKEWTRANAPPTFMPTSCVSKDGSNGSYEKPDGTVHSKPIEWNGEDSLELVLEAVIPDSTPASPGCAGLGDGVDSDDIKTVRIKSTMLSEFYNETIELEACVLLPFGFSDHPEARYPLVLANGHYNPKFNPGGEYRTTDPQCNEDDGYDCVTQNYAYYLHKNWTSTDEGMPFTGSRVLLITMNSPVPFFDDSYAVNSESMGPYGDALIYELIPEVERSYRGIGQGWARGAMGGSTGGWESAAHMILYPDEFGYALSACPDSVTFTRHTSVNLYENDNAYFYNSNFKRTPTPGYRDGYSGVTYPGYKTAYGDIITTFQEMNLRELALGDNSLSCGQCDAWEATWSPLDKETGYPKRIYDKATGVIDKDVANYWKENYDLANILVRDWETLGPKVSGRLHFAVGGSDSFYLDNAVYDFEQLLLSEIGEDHGVTFEFGAHQGLGFQHCFRGYEYDENGEPLPNSITRLTYPQDVIPRMTETFLKNAPEGADTESWRY